MKVICNKNLLYLDYNEVVDVIQESPYHYLVKGCDGDTHWYFKSFFEPVESDPIAELKEEVSDNTKAINQLTDMVISVVPKEVTIKVDWAKPDSDITVKEEKPKEPTVGDVITLKLRIEETANRSCKGCVFGSGDRCNNICDILGVPCNMDCREDGKDIIFKEVAERDINIDLDTKPSLPADYEMTVSRVSDDLRIGFYAGGQFYRIGWLDPYGKGLKMLSNDQLVKNYTLWRSKGCLYNKRTVEFKGGVYGIKEKSFNMISDGDIVFARIDIDGGEAYSISDGQPFRNCLDPNILRHEHNNVPIIF